MDLDQKIVDKSRMSNNENEQLEVPDEIMSNFNNEMTAYLDNSQSPQEAFGHIVSVLEFQSDAENANEIIVGEGVITTLEELHLPASLQNAIITLKNYYDVHNASWQMFDFLNFFQNYYFEQNHNNGNQNEDPFPNNDPVAPSGGKRKRKSKKTKKAKKSKKSKKTRRLDRK